MGLDITYASRIVRIGELDPDHYEKDCLYLYSCGHPDQPKRANGLSEGIYRSAGRLGGFRAGSYSGYNEWRAALARLVDTTDRAVWDDPKPGPFVELIDFSDCEGYFGPETCAKLAADFESHQLRAESLEGAAAIGDYPHDWFVDRYREWLKALRTASDSRALAFH